MVAGSSCSSSPISPDSRALADGPHIAAKIINAPIGYARDTSAGASGSMTPSQFSQFGGDGTATQAHFVAGFKQNYADTNTGEGLSITILKFSSSAAAAAYLSATAPGTLSYAAATEKAYPAIPGAIQVDGTKAYADEYAHGVIMTKKAYYVSFIYVNTLQGTPPFEVYEWAKLQYSRLA
jgi:hypothetical protein